MKLLYNDDCTLVIIMSDNERDKQEEFLLNMLEQVNEPEQILYILRMIERRKTLQ